MEVRDNFTEHYQFNDIQIQLAKRIMNDYQETNYRIHEDKETWI